MTEKPTERALGGITPLTRRVGFDVQGFAVAARSVGGSRHRLPSNGEHYAELTLAQGELSTLQKLAIHETMPRIEQRANRSLKGMRWSPLKDRSRLTAGAVADRYLIARMTTLRTARAWIHKEQERARSSSVSRSTSCAACCGAGASA